VKKQLPSEKFAAWLLPLQWKLPKKFFAESSKDDKEQQKLIDDYLRR
jgi:hypothetical protein